MKLLAISRGQPRVPCFKLGLKFKDPKIIETFCDFQIH